MLSCTFKGWSIESIKPPTTPNNNLTPNLYYQGTKTIASFPGACLRQDKVTFNHGKIVNIYIVYKLMKLSNIYKNNNLTIENALFGAVSLTKNADVDKYKYSGYGITFDKRGGFPFPGGGYGQNIMIFGADMNSSPHIDNKGKDILILATGPTQGLGVHSLTTEKFIRLILLKIIQNFV